MLVIVSAIIFSVSLHCADLNLLSLPGNSLGGNDLRKSVLFPHCDNQTIVSLLCVNQDIRAEVHQYLFDLYSFDSFPSDQNKIANVLISRYCIISLDTMYGHTTKLFTTRAMKCELFPTSEENRYLEILVQKTDFYNDLKNKFSNFNNWRLIKNRIFDHFVENKNEPELVIREMFDFIFKKTYVYTIDRDTLLITQNSETKLRNKRIFRCFCSFHAIINNISQIKQPETRRADDDWSWCYVPLTHLLGTYGVSIPD